MTPRLLFKIRHLPTLEAVRTLRHQLSPLLKSYAPPTDVRQRIELVIVEAFTNLVKHALPQPSFVEVCVHIDEQYLWIDLIDDGGSWNPTKQGAQPLGEFELKEDGLGVSLILTQSDRQHYTRDGSRNRLSLAWERRSLPRILLVDDDSSQLRLLTAYLQDQFDLTVAASGHEALEILRRQEISLVLSDIQMPDIDGFELREQLNHIPGKNLTPFLLLTGQDCTTHIAQASALGVDDYLTKPVDKTRLIHTLHRVLERTRQVNSHLQQRLDSEITSALAWKLPTHHEHWRLASFSKNSGQGGGDFIIHHSTGEQLVMALADTMGHDEGAKFFSHAFAGYLRGFINAGSGELEPSVLLNKLSDAAWNDQLFSRTTLSCCTFSLMPSGRIELASAGHPAPLMVKRSGVEAIDVSGVLPGLMAGSRYQSVNIKLEAGDRVAIYTDGLFDSAATEDSRHALETKILSALKQSANQSIEQALLQIEHVFDDHAGLLPKDDASLLLLEPALN